MDKSAGHVLNLTKYPIAPYYHWYLVTRIVLKSLIAWEIHTMTTKPTPI